MENLSKVQNDAENKRKKLYWDQKWLLDDFLENGAITPAQYNKSLTCLTEKMGMQGQPEPERKRNGGVSYGN